VRVLHWSHCLASKVDLKTERGTGMGRGDEAEVACILQWCIEKGSTLRTRTRGRVGMCPMLPAVRDHKGEGVLRKKTKDCTAVGGHHLLVEEDEQWGLHHLCDMLVICRAAMQFIGRCKMSTRS
jgi:hypothetical protein